MSSVVKSVLAVLWVIFSQLSPWAAGADFGREIRPVLAEHCFQCHGPDEAARKGKLRLDTREGLFSPRDGGRTVVAGRPEASVLFQRIATTKAEDLMPPVKHNKPLSAKQVGLIREWISQGAAWEQHWAFVPPVRSGLPRTITPGWARNAIDAFVLARLEREKMQPSREAERSALIRRVSLDLTGLPPKPEEVADFIADTRADAFERVVDRLLASPRFGEHWARAWLDAARFADTNGYNNDEERTMWAWRDWVINALNSNLPFDRFLTEQLAGDLLPGATRQQQVATGFSRNHVLTTEGGIIEEEYRVEYVADRVHTTATAFLGLTMQCARCHDHKFDPLTQRDYYRMFAFFNGVPDRVVGYNSKKAAAPFVAALTPAQEAEQGRLRVALATTDARLAERKAQAGVDLARWEAGLSADERARLARTGAAVRFALDEKQGGEVHCAVDPQRKGKVLGTPSWKPGRLGSALEFDGRTRVEAGEAVAFESGDKVSFGAWIFPREAGAMAVMSKIDDQAAYRGFDLIFESGKLAVHLVNRWPDRALKIMTQTAMSLKAWHHVFATVDGSGKATGVKIYVDGKAQALTVEQDGLAGSLKTTQPFRIGQRSASVPFKGLIDEVEFYRTVLTPAEVEGLAQGKAVGGLMAVIDRPAAERTAAERERLLQYYIGTVDPESRRLRVEREGLLKQLTATEEGVAMTMVMQEAEERRTAFVLRRGQYDQRGEAVEAGPPESLPPLPAGVPRNRLGLAQWMTQPGHPLTARVAVNRWWEGVFGVGLVETVEDFGTQGARPSHPELLDWLATELVRTGWDMKALLRLIVTSAMYRQTTAATAELVARDPQGRLLGRAPRFRLAGEVIRDQALAVAGLLSARVGGPSVKPYQPPGLWEDVSVERKYSYVDDVGEGLYRRSLYTFWKRTCPPPGMTTLDAPDRETCVARRARTSTPLQALLLLNDATYVEAARLLAERVIGRSGPEVEAGIRRAYQLVLAREPQPREVEVLVRLHGEALARFRERPEAVKKLLGVGRTKSRPGLDEAELAAWTTVASLLLNLDETITKP